MLFNSWTFAVFFTVVLAVYHSVPHRWQNRLLLVANYVFYGAWDWRFTSLLFISTTVDWWAGLHLDPDKSPAYRKRVLLLSCLFNLGFLGVFKLMGLDDCFNSFHDGSLPLRFQVIAFFTVLAQV